MCGWETRWFLPHCQSKPPWNIRVEGQRITQSGWSGVALCSISSSRHFKSLAIPILGQHDQWQCCYLWEHFGTLARNYLETWMPSHKTTSARGKTMNLPQFQATNPNFLPFWLQEIDVLHLPFWGSKLPIPSQSSPTTTRQSGARSQGDRVVPCASSSRSSWRLSRERDRSADGVWDSHGFFCAT